MPESAILATYTATPIHMMKGVQAGPNTQTSHLSLTSKAGPDRATYRVRGTIRSDAHTYVGAAIFHWSIFRADWGTNLGRFLRHRRHHDAKRRPPSKLVHLQAEGVLPQDEDRRQPQNGVNVNNYVIGRLLFF